MCFSSSSQEEEVASGLKAILANCILVMTAEGREMQPVSVEWRSGMLLNILQRPEHTEALSGPSPVLERSPKSVRC